MWQLSQSHVSSPRWLDREVGSSLSGLLMNLEWILLSSRPHLWSFPLEVELLRQSAWTFQDSLNTLSRCFPEGSGPLILPVAGSSFHLWQLRVLETQRRPCPGPRPADIQQLNTSSHTHTRTETAISFEGTDWLFTIPYASSKQMSLESYLNTLIWFSRHFVGYLGKKGFWTGIYCAHFPITFQGEIKRDSSVNLGWWWTLRLEESFMRGSPRSSFRPHGSAVMSCWVLRLAAVLLFYILLEEKSHIVARGDLSFCPPPILPFGQCIAEFWTWDMNF